MSFDYIIVGAGICGITAAEELANVMNKNVLLIDKRDHIGGNCYDYVNENGNLIHKYGPHVLHTDNTQVFNYLSLFTRWNNYNHKILLKDENSLIPVPFNFISIDKCLKDYSEEIKIALIDNYKINEDIPVIELLGSDNKYLRKLGCYIYNAFSNYFKKLYGIDDEMVMGYVDQMLPFRMSYDCRYYKNIYQAEPTHGFTNMFNNMLSNHKITVMLNKDYHEIIKIDYDNNKIYYEDEEFKGHLIFTGMIDEFFDYEYGELSYNSLILENEDIKQSRFQDNATIYYSENYHFTRITDFEYLSQDLNDSTVIQFEYPVAYDRMNEEQNVPYYPLNQDKDKDIYAKYKKLADDYENVTFIGRLAEYKLVQMDECVEKVLSLIGNELI